MTIEEDSQFYTIESPRASSKHVLWQQISSFLSQFLTDNKNLYHSLDGVPFNVGADPRAPLE